MRLRLMVVLFALVSIAGSAHAQTPPNTSWTFQGEMATLLGKAGIGVAPHTTARLRLAADTGYVTDGPFQLTFGSTTAMYWGFRFDADKHLHLDRQSDTGWAEGFVFTRNGNFGIGTNLPQYMIHAVRDHNSGSILRLSNASTGDAAYRSLQFSEGDAVKAEIKSVGSGNTAAIGNANALQIWNYAAAPTLFATSNLERMRIATDGNVSIGSTATASKLGVTSLIDNYRAVQVTQRATVEATPIPPAVGQNDTGLLVQAMQDVAGGVTTAGSITGAQIEGFNMGPAGTVSAIVGSLFRVGNYHERAGTVTNAYAIKTAVQVASGTITNGYGVEIGDTQATSDFGIFQVAANDTNYFAGNVVIGGSSTGATTMTNALNVVGTTGMAASLNVVAAAGMPYALTVQGHAHFNGTVTGTNIQAHYQDVAEWVPATTELAPGTVVILNRERNNEVMASGGAYDTTVAGVVSAQPGISLGVEGAGKAQIATTGRVRVRVDARSQPVRIGDLLVTSDVPGTAMRSVPMSINGRAFHQPGTILGKALEPLDRGVGEILVLLSMQ